MATGDYAEDCEDDEKKRKKKTSRSSPLREEKKTSIQTVPSYLSTWSTLIIEYEEEREGVHTGQDEEGAGLSHLGARGG